MENKNQEYKFNFSITNSDDEIIQQGSVFINEQGDEEIVEFTIGKTMRQFKTFLFKLKEKEAEEEEVFTDEDKADFTGASDELGYANDR